MTKGAQCVYVHALHSHTLAQPKPTHVQIYEQLLYTAALLQEPHMSMLHVCMEEVRESHWREHCSFQKETVHPTLARCVCACKRYVRAMTGH